MVKGPARGRKIRCGCVAGRRRRRISVCREHAEYWCNEHGLGFTAPNRAGVPHVAPLTSYHNA
jgi:hypothetical protein